MVAAQGFSVADFLEAIQRAQDKLTAQGEGTGADAEERAI